MTSTQDILDAALRLAPDERARLLAAIADSLDTVDLTPEWEAEISRRVADLDAGRVATVPGAEALSDLRRKHGG